jgi:hypothetical protein
LIVGDRANFGRTTSKAELIAKNRRSVMVSRRAVIPVANLMKSRRCSPIALGRLLG